jgi:hypothetical protein
METCNQEHESVHTVSPDSDTDLSDLGKDDLLFPNVYPVVKIEVKVSMYMSLIVFFLLQHLLICSDLLVETSAVLCPWSESSDVV